MNTAPDSFGAEGSLEIREEALEKFRAATFTIRNNQFEFRGSNRINIKGIQIFVEFEFDGVPQKDFAMFRGKA